MSGIALILEQAQSEYDQLTKIICEQRQEFHRLYNEVESLKAENEQLKGNVNQLKKELKIFVDKFSEADHYGNQAQEAIGRLSDKNGWLKTELDTLKKQIREIYDLYKNASFGKSTVQGVCLQICADLSLLIEPEKKESNP